MEKSIMSFTTEDRKNRIRAEGQTALAKARDLT
jgi:hypothetical protein